MNVKLFIPPKHRSKPDCKIQDGAFAPHIAAKFTQALFNYMPNREKNTLFLNVCQ